MIPQSKKPTCGPALAQADRKDPGHSGHTDSVYYAHVKAGKSAMQRRSFDILGAQSLQEQQAMEKQALELRRMKKRQRQMTPRRKAG